MQVRIYYKDTDMGGIVYHSRYIDFCEMARSEFFFSHGRSPVVEGCHFAVKKIDADYKKPAFLGDLLDVESRLVALRRTGVQIRHTIQRDHEPIFTMEILLVFLNPKGRPVRIPEELAAFLAQLPRA